MLLFVDRRDWGLEGRENAPPCHTFPYPQFSQPAPPLPALLLNPDVIFCLWNPTHTPTTLSCVGQGTSCLPGDIEPMTFSYSVTAYPGEPVWTDLSLTMERTYLPRLGGGGGSGVPPAPFPLPPTQHQFAHRSPHTTFFY